MSSYQTDRGRDYRNGYAVVGLLLLSFLFISVSEGKADWINLTGAQSAPNIAEIYVEKDRVRLVLEIYPPNLATFVGLLPDEFLNKGGIKAPPLAKRIFHFSQKDFQIITQSGEKLQAKLSKFEPRKRKERPFPFAGAINPVTRRPIPGPPKDKRVFYAELEYSFKTRPDQLTIVPPLDARGIPAVSIGFIAYHEDVPVVDYRFLPSSATLSLDWEDPWYTKFDNKSLKRWQQSGMKMYLYVEPYEVRHEVLVRVKDVGRLIDLGLRGTEFIEVDEIEPLKKRIGEFFLKHSDVRIDGKRMDPILDRTSFVKYTMTRTFFLDQPERMPLNTALMGIIITYLTNGMPQEVSVDWTVFSDRIQKVPTSAIDPAGPFPSYVTPEDNLLVWKNYLKSYKIPTVAHVTVQDSLIKLNVPMASVACLALLALILLSIRKRSKNSQPIRIYLVLAALLTVGIVILYPFAIVTIGRPAIIAPKMTDKEAVRILDSLLKNVYRAFDFRGEEAVYDRLATSVKGDLLSEIYLQNRKSLMVTQAGGARARVKEVKILDAKMEQKKERGIGLLIRARWTALGTVGHWGHIHTRENMYDANVTVEPVDGVWKITRLELLEEKRIDPYGQSQKAKTVGES
ncbi:hypothetical protein ACFL2Q_04325 [Thermodesulfobacteriota bacterium]